MRYNRKHMAKRFDQYCPVAHSLCLVGERWALLIVRELMQGPSATRTWAKASPASGRTSSRRGCAPSRKPASSESAGCPPRRLDRLRADRVRRGARGGHLRARPLGRPLAGPAGARGRALPRVGRQRLRRSLLARGGARAHRNLRPADRRRRLLRPPRRRANACVGRRRRERRPRGHARHADVLPARERRAHAGGCPRPGRGGDRGRPCDVRALLPGSQHDAENDTRPRAGRAPLRRMARLPANAFGLGRSTAHVGKLTPAQPPTASDRRCRDR